MREKVQRGVEGGMLTYASQCQELVSVAGENILETLESPYDLHT